MLGLVGWFGWLVWLLAWLAGLLKAQFQLCRCMMTESRRWMTPCTFTQLQSNWQLQTNATRMEEGYLDCAGKPLAFPMLPVPTMGHIQNAEWKTQRLNQSRIPIFVVAEAAAFPEVVSGFLAQAERPRFGEKKNNAQAGMNIFSGSDLERPKQVEANEDFAFSFSLFWCQTSVGHPIIVLQNINRHNWM